MKTNLVTKIVCQFTMERMLVRHFFIESVVECVATSMWRQETLSSYSLDQTMFNLDGDSKQYSKSVIHHVCNCFQLFFTMMFEYVDALLRKPKCFIKKYNGEFFSSYFVVY